MTADPSHQLQMLLKTIGNALTKEDLGTAMKLAGHLFEVGGNPTAFVERKVHVLLRAMEGATPSVKTEFASRLLDAYGEALDEDARGRLSGRLDRL